MNNSTYWLKAVSFYLLIFISLFSCTASVDPVTGERKTYEMNEKERIKFLARVYFQTKNPKYKVYAEEVINKGDFAEDSLTFDYIKYCYYDNNY
jgi:hypothetical protein